MKNLNIDKSSWKLVKFGDVVAEPKETVTDLAASGLAHVVGLEHIDTESVHLRRSAGIEESTTFTKRFAVGDVLFGRRRAYLKKAAQASFDGICSGDIILFRAKKNLLPELLPFIVNNDKFFDYAVKHSAGGLSPRVKFKDLANYEFLLPPKEQQAELAELLWAMDDVIEKDLAVLEKLEDVRSILRESEMCSKKFVRNELGKGLHGILAGKSLNGDNIPVVENEKGVLKVSAVGAKGFDSIENKKLNVQHDFIEKYAIKCGDVLITRANTRELVGRICLVDKDYPNLMLSDKTLRLDINEKVYDKLFVVEVMKSREVRSQIESNATGTGGAMKNITQPEIKALKLPTPEIQIQKKLSQKLNSVLENNSKIEFKISASKALQKSLINEIF